MKNIGPSSARADGSRSQRRVAKELVADDRPFNAFISYHHSDSSARLAESFHHQLLRFGKAFYSRTTLRIFRDKANLSANPGLRSAIFDAMSRSEFLILLATPGAASSPWVEDEARFWRQNKPMDNVILVLADGRITWNQKSGDFAGETNALPQALFGAFSEQPTWVELPTTLQRNLRRRDPAFRTSMADVAAPLNHVSKDQMIGQDVTHLRRTRLLLALVAIIMFGLAVSVGVFGWQAHLRKEQAVRAERAAVARELAALAPQQHDLAQDELGVLLARQAYLLSLETGGAARELVDRALRASMSARPFARVLSSPDTLLASAAIDSQGSFLAAAGSGRQVSVWNLGHPWEGPSIVQGSRAVALTPNGRTLVTGLGGDVLLRGPLNLSKPPTRLHGAAEEVFSVAVSSDSTMVAAGTASGSLMVWNLARSEAEPTLLQGPAAIVRSIVFSSSGHMLAWADDSGTVSVWRVGSPVDAVTRVTAHEGIAASVGFSPDGTRMASGGYDGRVRIWDVGDLDAPLVELPGNTREVTSLTFLNQSTLVSGQYDGTVRVWDLASPKEPLRVYRGHGTAVEPILVAFAQEANLLVSAGAGTVVVFDLNPVPPGAVTMRYDFDGMEAQIFSVSFDRLGRRVAWGTSGGDVWIRSLQGESGTRISPPGAQVVKSVAFVPWTDWLAAAGLAESGASIWLYDESTGNWTQLGGSPVHGGVESVAVSPDGRVLAAGTRDGRVRIYDLRKLHNPPRDIFVEGIVSAVAFSADGQRLVAGVSGVDSGGAVVVWSLDGSEVSRVLFRDQFEWVTAVATSANGGSVAVGLSSGRVVLWDPEGGELRNVPYGPSDSVDALAFTPGEETLIAGSRDQTVRLWLLEPPATARSISGTPTTVPLAVLRDHHNGVRSVAVSRDGTLLASAGDDGRIVVQAPTSVLADRACDIVWRDLNPEEWVLFVGNSLPYTHPCPDRPVIQYPFGP